MKTITCNIIFTFPEETKTIICNIIFTFPEETLTLREEICARWIFYGRKKCNWRVEFKVKFKEVTVQIGKYIDILRNLYVQNSKILRI